jgi:hypothetical protein
MTKRSKPSPNNAGSREQQFEKLMAAMGMSEAANAYSRYALTQDLEHIERQCARWIAASGKQPDVDLVRSYRKAVTRVLKLSEKIGPDFLANEIEMAGWARNIPDADEQTLHALMADHGHRRQDVVAVLTVHGLDVDHWLDINDDTYRKRELRKRVVEPFLQLMAKHGITSRKQRPRKRIFDSLFDWLGVEQKSRPSSANIDTIARELEGAASASNSNAKRRTKK